MLVTLILSALPIRQDLRSAAGCNLLTKFVGAADVAHVALEWRHVQTGALLVTGRVLWWYKGEASGKSADLLSEWYVLHPGNGVAFETLPFVDRGRALSAREFLRRLAGLLGEGDAHSSPRLVWKHDRRSWSSYLAHLGFPSGLSGYHSHWLRMLNEEFPKLRNQFDLAAFVAAALMRDEDLARLDVLVSQYNDIRAASAAPATGPAQLRGIEEMKSAQAAAVSGLAGVVRSVLAALRVLPELSRLPATAATGTSRPCLRISFDEVQDDELLPRLRDLINDAELDRRRNLVALAVLAAVSDRLQIDLLRLSQPHSQEWLTMPKQLHSLSAGERRISAILLSFVLTRWAYQREGLGDAHLDAVFIDDALGAVSSRKILDIELATAKSIGLQVIYAASHCDARALSAFSRIVALRRADTVVGTSTVVVDHLPRSPESPHVSLDHPGGDRDDTKHTALGDLFEVLPTLSSWQLVNRNLPDAPSEHVTQAGRTKAMQGTARQPFVQQGDMLLTRVFPWHRHGTVATAVSTQPGESAFDDSVVVLRPRQLFTPDENLFFLRYFNSDAFLGQFASAAGLGCLDPSSLPLSSIPRPDKATLRAITELSDAAHLFAQWQEDAAKAVDGFFQQQSRPAARSRVIDAGRLTRQRREAASAANTLGRRLRATLPYPIASLWRAVEAAQPNDAGYSRVLGCAEATIAYCAALGHIYSVAAQRPLKQPQSFSARFGSGKMGVTFGYWRAVVSELAEKAAAPSLPADSPLAQFGSFGHPGVAASLDSLADRRNALAHRRGPQHHEVRVAFNSAKGEMETILASVEWLVDYPVRLIDSCHWDSFKQSSQVIFRELMGDHNVVSPAMDTIADVLETGSAYVVDRYGDYQLLRPVLTVQTCPTCGQLSMFALDRWHPETEQADYLALEHPHTIRLRDVATALERVGLLPRPKRLDRRP